MSATKSIRRTTVNLTQATERQVKALTAQGFGTFTDVVRIAIDRMYRTETRKQETAMDEIKSIEIVVTEDALFGNATPADEYNVKASIEAYCTDLANHLYDKYPRARIEVEAGVLDSVRVNGQSDHVEVNVVKELSDRVWNAETWLVH